MSYSKTEITDLLQKDSVKSGDIKKLAKEIKKDHELAMELWATGEFHPRQLAVLILDRKVIDQAFMTQFAVDLTDMPEDEWKQISDWLYANQLSKSKKLMEMVDTWMSDDSIILRKLFWTRQYRLRWTGKTDQDNTDQLIDIIEQTIATEDPAIQEVMNMTAGWIGVYQPEYRERLSQFGEQLGLFKDVKVSPGCTPWYLPEFIRIEAEKRGL